MIAKKIRVIDIETLFEEPTENGICEVGWTDVISQSADLFGQPIDWYVSASFSSLINPLQPIPAETSAVHHIIDEDVRNSPTWDAVKHEVFGDKSVVAYAAHGAKFERAWLGAELTNGLPWIDTYRCALWIHQDAPSFSNSALRYYLKPEGLVRSKADPAHRAGPDSYVTAFHVRDMLNGGTSVQQLIEWTYSPALLPRCKIGDSYRNGGKGTPWKDVESSMLRWILSKSFDEDTMFTARHHLEQREMDQRNERERQELNRQYRENGLPETKSFDDGYSSPTDQQQSTDRASTETKELPL